MKTLSTEPIKQYYFIKEGVVYEISKKNNPDDECCISYEELKDKLPKVSATTGSEEPKVYYLDYLIKDGDTYDGDKFEKTIHSSSDSAFTFTEYYTEICMNYIEEAVKEYFDKDAEFFNEHKNVLNVPEWFVDSAYTVNPDFCQFIITDNSLEEIKTSILQKVAFTSANNALDKYGYKLSSPSSADEIEVEEKE